MTKEIQFNTGRNYTAQGQEIAAKLVCGIVYFYDQSRMVGGQFNLEDYETFNAEAVMYNYDNNKYSMWTPPHGFF